MSYYEGIVKNTEFFTTSELAEKLKMNAQVITRKVQAGEIIAYKLGKDWRIPEQSVYDWLQSNSNKNGNGKKRKAPVKPPTGSMRAAESIRRNDRTYLLEYILAQFEPNRKYTKEQVNRIVGRFHDDFRSVREEFVKEKMMISVDGSFCRCAGYKFSD